MPKKKKTFKRLWSNKDICNLCKKKHKNTLCDDCDVKLNQSEDAMNLADPAGNSELFYGR